MRVIDARFDRCRTLQAWRRIVDSLRLRKMILDVWIAFDARDVRTRRQCFGDVSCSFYKKR